MVSPQRPLQPVDAATSSCPFSGHRGAEVPAAHLSNVEDTWYLVGDRLRAQSKQPGLISISALEKMLDALPAQAQLMPIGRLVVGQGVSESRLAALYRRLQSDPGAPFRLEPEQPPRKATLALTHKHHDNNILITDPEECGSDVYRARLLVDESCAEMSDHLTGVHLQGMVIAEAGRQMLLAVTEKFLIAGLPPRRVRFVTHSMSVTYLDFLFPLPVGITYRANVVRGAGSANFKCGALIRFFQNGILGAEMDVSFSVLDERYLLAREHGQLGKVMNSDARSR